MVLMMLGLMAMLGSALAATSSGSLVLCRQSAQAERALALADTGLTTATQKLIAYGSMGSSASEVFPGEGSFLVERRVNNSNAPLNTPWGLVMPAKTTLLRSTGTTREGVSRVSIALFRSSAGAFQVGALANSITGTGSTFDAYDSNSETPGYTGLVPDPLSMVTGSTILASNQSSGVVVNLTGSTVDGAAFVGPGGNTAAQMILDAASTVGLTGSLAAPIEQPAIVVPSMPNGPSTTPPNTANPKTVYLQDGSGDKDTTITPPSTAGGPVTLTHYCLTLKIYPDGRFTAREGGSGSEIKGDIQDGTFSTVSPASTGTPLTVVSYNPLDIKGNWHHAVYDPANSSIAIDQQGIRTPAPAPVTHPSLPPWIFYAAPAPAAVSPATLQPGKYDTVNVQGNMTSLVDGGVYVVKNLRVDALGKIYLPATASNTKIYVTGSLIIDGAEAIVNDSRKPTALKIFYTGTSPVTISGGSAAFASLYAPGADVTLSGYDSGFYGAISCKNLTVNQAKFHYDVATQGVGTGLDSSAFQLLARYHP